MTEREMSEQELEAIAEHVRRDGRIIADRVMRLAVGSPDIAIAILGVAVGRIIDDIDESKRAETLREFLASFE